MELDWYNYKRATYLLYCYTQPYLAMPTAWLDQRRASYPLYTVQLGRRIPLRATSTHSKTLSHLGGALHIRNDHSDIVQFSTNVLVAQLLASYGEGSGGLRI